MTIYEFEEVYDPSYLNLDKNDPDAWKVYAEKVRTLITLLDSTQTKLTEAVEENKRLRVEIETTQTELSNSKHICTGAY